MKEGQPPEYPVAINDAHVLRNRIVTTLANKPTGGQKDVLLNFAEVNMPRITSRIDDQIRLLEFHALELLAKIQTKVK